MKSIDILELIGETPDKYVLDAQNVTAAKVRRPRRIGLIAAIVAAMVLLMGSAVVWLNIEEMITLSPIYAREGDMALSMQGSEGSNEYQAAKEWLEFRWSYDPDLAIYKSLTEEQATMPEEYRDYGCYTPEMTTKVDEICEKYGLNKLGKAFYELGEEEFFEYLSIPAFTCETAQVELNVSPGYFYQSGTFSLEADAQLAGEDREWSHWIEFQYRCVMKTDFDDTILNIGDISDYAQWTYTTKSGIKVLLALSERKALVIVDKEDCFITLNILNPTAEDGTQWKMTMSKEVLEAFANLFSFASPKPIADEVWAELTAE